MEMFTRANICGFSEQTLETRSLSTCNELFIGCSSHKDQVWDTWMVQTQNHVSFIFWIVQIYCMVCECCVSI